MCYIQTWVLLHSLIRGNLFWITILVRPTDGALFCEVKRLTILRFSSPNSIDLDSSFSSYIVDKRFIFIRLSSETIHFPLIVLNLSRCNISFNDTFWRNLSWHVCSKRKGKVLFAIDRRSLFICQWDWNFLENMGAF